jgi:hypothetical protein
MVRVTPSNGRQEVRRPSVRSRQASVWLRLLVVISLCLAVVRADRPVTAAGSREYELKSAYVLNFIKFVDWPAQRLSPNSTTITVCVAGREAYRAATETIHGKSVKGKTISVIQYSGAQDLSRAHVLFVTADPGQIASLLDGTRAAGVLTVGESSGFTKDGGIIGFRNVDNKIRFDINARAAEGSGLTISSQLLKLARVVQ